MLFFNYTTPKMIVAEQGKHIRAINDVYVPEHKDEEGNLIPEHIPYYSTTIFVPILSPSAQPFRKYLFKEKDRDEVVAWEGSRFRKDNLG